MAELIWYQFSEIKPKALSKPSNSHKNPVGKAHTAVPFHRWQTKGQVHISRSCKMTRTCNQSGEREEEGRASGNNPAKGSFPNNSFFGLLGHNSRPKRFFPLSSPTIISSTCAKISLKRCHDFRWDYTQKIKTPSSPTTIPLISRCISVQMGSFRPLLADSPLKHKESTCMWRLKVFTS